MVVNGMSRLERFQTFVLHYSIQYSKVISSIFLKKAIMFECIEEFYREPNPSLIDKFQVHL